jgi:hypothetical protein
MQMKQHECYMNSVVQIAKSKSDFIVAGLTAKVSLDELRSQASTLFEPPPPPHTHLPSAIINKIGARVFCACTQRVAIHLQHK